MKGSARDLIEVLCRNLSGWNEEKKKTSVSIAGRDSKTAHPKHKSGELERPTT
jgi:hypothetical protein